MQVTTLRLALAWTLLCSRHVVQTLASLQPASWPELATKAAKCSSGPHPTVLLVLDPNGILCWENVAINAFTNATFLPWLHGRRDALTLGADRQGIHIQASFWSVATSNPVLDYHSACCMCFLHVCNSRYSCVDHCREHRLTQTAMQQTCNVRSMFCMQPVL